MRLVLALHPSRKKDTVLGFEWFEPQSFGYNQDGELTTIVGIAPYSDNSWGLFAIEEPELHDDLMINYVVQQ